MRVLSVQPDDDTPLGLIAGPLADAGIEVEVWEPRVATPPAGPYDGMIVLGSSANPDEDRFESWIPAVRGEVSLALELGLPLLGVCFGAQILTEQLGGRTARLDRPEIGWVELEPTAAAADDPLFGEMSPGGAPMLEWHQYAMESPRGAVALVEPTSCEQAWRIEGRDVWAVQFHFEADAAIAEDWIAGSIDELAARGLDPSGLRAASHASAPKAEPVATAIAAGFSSVVTSRSAA
jgi:GMP synthase-like glutamine amidotransferase